MALSPFRQSSPQIQKFLYDRCFFWAHSRSYYEWSAEVTHACRKLTFFRCVIGLPHKELGRLPANNPLETTSCGPQISGRQIFLYVPASNFVLPPRSSLPLRILPQGSRGFYVRAERASLPPHAPDMLTVRIQATDGTRTFTSLDPRPCRLLPPWSAVFPPQ